MRKIVFPILLITLVGTLVSSCKKNESYEKKRKREVQIRNEYIRKNHPGVTPEKSGLYFIQDEKLAGDTARPVKFGDMVKVRFDMYIIVNSDSLKLISSATDYQPRRFEINNSPPLGFLGFYEALQLMNEKAEAKIVVPSRLGFANQDRNNYGVPIYTNLVFNIAIKEVIKDDDEGIDIRMANSNP